MLTLFFVFIFLASSLPASTTVNYFHLADLCGLVTLENLKTFVCASREHFQTLYKQHIKFSTICLLSICPCPQPTPENVARVWRLSKNLELTPTDPCFLLYMFFGSDVEILLSCAIVAFLACFCLFWYEKNSFVDFMNVVFGRNRAESARKQTKMCRSLRYDLWAFILHSKSYASQIWSVVCKL